MAVCQLHLPHCLYRVEVVRPLARTAAAEVVKMDSIVEGTLDMEEEEGEDMMTDSVAYHQESGGEAKLHRKESLIAEEEAMVANGVDEDGAGGELRAYSVAISHTLHAIVNIGMIRTRTTKQSAIQQEHRKTKVSADHVDLILVKYTQNSSTIRTGMHDQSLLQMTRPQLISSLANVIGIHFGASCSPYQLSPVCLECSYCYSAPS
jgi:hypothetical protein